MKDMQHNSLYYSKIYFIILYTTWEFVLEIIINFLMLFTDASMRKYKLDTQKCKKKKKITTHQYSDHDQRYISDPGLEKCRSVRDVDADARTPLADLVSHIILYMYI